MNLKHIKETIRAVKRALPGVRIELLRQERHCVVAVAHEGAYVTAVLPLSPKSADAAVRIGTTNILRDLEKCKTQKATSPVSAGGDTQKPGTKKPRAARSA